MAELPDELRDLLNATDPKQNEEAWARFLNRYSKLIIATCHKHLHWEDGAMDGYIFVLDHLCAKDFARLRKYTPCKGCKFETWLVQVVKRLCIDCWRERYKIKRPQKGDDDPDSPAAKARWEEQELIRTLVDLLVKSLDVIVPPETDDESADAKLVRREMFAALTACIEALPERERLLIKLRFIDRATAAEVASLMKFTTQWHVFRAEQTVLKTLRACLAGKGITRA